MRIRFPWPSRKVRLLYQEKGNPFLPEEVLPPQGFVEAVLGPPEANLHELLVVAGEMDPVRRRGHACAGNPRLQAAKRDKPTVAVAGAGCRHDHGRSR